MKKLEGIWCFTVFVMIMNFCVEILNGMKIANMSFLYYMVVLQIIRPNLERKTQL